jgi:tetratricopeptide (TPR) repeat protein
LALAVEASEAMKKGDSSNAVDLFQADGVELEQALLWTQQHAALETWFRMSWAYALFQVSFGSSRLGIDVLDEAIKADPRTPAERHLSAMCHVLAAGARALQWDHAPMMKLLRRARDLAADSSDEALLQKIDYLTCMVYQQQLRTGAVEKVARRMIDRATRIERADHVAAAYACLVTACQLGGDYRRARDAAEQAIAWSRSAQAPVWMVMSHCVCAGSEISLGELALAQASLHDALQWNRVARRPSMEFHLHLHASVLAFEKGDFDDCTRRLEKVRELSQSYVPRLAIVVDLWREFVLIERGRGAEAVVLIGLTAQDFPFDSDFAGTYACTLKYRLQLLATRRDGAAAQAAVRAWRPLLRRSGNLLWASWAAESAAVAAQQIGCIALARRFLDLSPALLARAKINATPRQKNSWSRLADGLRVLPFDTPSAAAEGDGLAAALASLLHDIGDEAEAMVPRDNEVVAAGH